MRAQSQKVDSELPDVDGKLAGGLHGIRVEDSAVVAAQRCQRADGMDRADLVVGVQDRNDRHPRRKVLGQRLLGNMSVRVDGEDKKTPLFRAAVRRTNTLSENPMSRVDAFRMIKRRARVAGLPDSTCCHTFRATGITAYLDAGGTIENAQAIAAHESPRTTKLYDRTSDEFTLDEIERIAI